MKLSIIVECLRRLGAYSTVSDLSTTDINQIVNELQNQGVRYFGVFLEVFGCNGNLPTIIAFQANYVITNGRRSVANGL
jgi:DNA invertase Pin-like site-specific DNA recombinase